ncbi:MAG: CDP-diglyceride synthetase, partial [Acidimicrobiia bacterium]|nr:CDP-diglyceride synthetase [Acidimicrobiia bacterium]
MTDEHDEDVDPTVGNVSRRRPADDRTEGVRIIAGDEPSSEEPPLRFSAGTDETTQLPHWTDPPTGEIPRPSPDDTANLDAWSSYASAPVWKEEKPGELNLVDMTSETRIGALADRDDDPSDFFPELEPLAPEPAVVTPIRTRQARGVPPQGRRVSSSTTGGGDARRRPAIEGGPGPSQTGGRNLPVAIGVGVGLAAVALLLFKLGPKYTMALVVVVLVGAAAELFEVMRRGGYQPATLLGLVATGALPLALYWKGDIAFGVVISLTIASAFCWYMFADPEAPALVGVSTTVFGFLYVGVLGSFAALILRIPRGNGIGVLAGTVVCVVAVDVGGLVLGASSGTSKMAPSISPNKTWEGLFGGVVFALIAGLVFGSMVKPWENWKQGLLLGGLTAVAAVLGDLAESKLKR